jgi:hypothetical protein
MPHGHRQRQVPIGPTCAQCGKEKQIPERGDKLGLNCATVKDRSQQKARAFADEQKKHGE